MQYGCRFTDETGTTQIQTSIDPSGAPISAHDVDILTRIRRTWQEDRLIDPDAVVVRRERDGEPWEVVPRMGKCSRCLLTTELDEHAFVLPHELGGQACAGAGRYPTDLAPVE